jgi:hypothetical protein
MAYSTLPIGLAAAESVRQVVARLREAAWQPVPTVGAGEEFRSDTDDGQHASALIFEGSVVHGSLILVV